MATRGVILIIDDNATFREIYRDSLLNDGYQVLEAPDGEEGLNILRKEHVDAVVCDMLMPKKSGMQVLEEMAADEKLKHIPVIALSVLGEHSDVEKAKKAGATEYLIKGMHGPIDVSLKLASILAPKTS
jgi:CheY-like chemotaxis protein